MFFFFLMWSKLKNKTICSVMSVKMITSANTLNWIYTSLKTMQGRWNAINHWNESQCYNCCNYNVVKIHWKCREILFARNLPLFIRPSSDGTYYGMVMSVRPSVRPSQFSALFSYMLWHIDLKFCVSLYFYARKIKFECHQFPSLFAGVMLLFNFKLFQICSFPHFSPTCFDILSSNFVYDFVFMYHRASLSVVILLQFLYELCSFLTSNSFKYAVFRTFLLHALTYWVQILYMTLFLCTTEQVWVSSFCFKFLYELCLFVN